MWCWPRSPRRCICRTVQRRRRQTRPTQRCCGSVSLTCSVRWTSCVRTCWIPATHLPSCTPSCSACTTGCPHALPRLHGAACACAGPVCRRAVTPPRALPVSSRRCSSAATQGVMQRTPLPDADPMVLKIAGMFGSDVDVSYFRSPDFGRDVIRLSELVSTCHPPARWCPLPHAHAPAPLPAQRRRFQRSGACWS